MLCQSLASLRAIDTAWGSICKRNSHTIFALASGSGKAGVSIIRISGPQAIQTLSSLTSTVVNLIRPRYAMLKKLYDPKDHQFLDEAVVLLFNKPNSFTGEDVVELHIHGGPANVQKFYKVLGIMGCTLAEPGEFTRRAFMNNRLHIAQVEGILDLVNAETESQRRLATSLYSGLLTDKLAEYRKSIIKNMAYLETLIDFGHDEDNDPNIPLHGSNSQRFITEDRIFNQVRFNNLDHMHNLMSFIISQQNRGFEIKHGLNVTICGETNVGKSSFMNILNNNQDVSIVTDIPGTTRDVVSRPLQINGYKINLQDTAGIRDLLTTSDADKIEKLGIHKSLESINSSPFILLVLDISRILSVDYIHKMLSNLTLTRDHIGSKKRIIVILNKIDTASKINNINSQADDVCNATEMIEEVVKKDYQHVLDLAGVCPISCKTNQGIDQFMLLLGNTLCEYFNVPSPTSTNNDSDLVYLAHERHEQHLNQSLNECFLFEELLTQCNVSVPYGDYTSTYLTYKSSVDIVAYANSDNSVEVPIIISPIISLYAHLYSYSLQRDFYSSYINCFAFHLFTCIQKSDTTPIHSITVISSDTLQRTITQADIDTYVKTEIHTNDIDLLILAEYLRSAAYELAKVAGKVINDDILTSIFKDFCIGK